MSDFSIINSVFSVLCADSVFLGYFDLTAASTAEAKALKIQKEYEANGLATSNIPLCCIYPVPGLPNKRNPLMYDALFEVAIYSNNSSGAKTSNTKAGTMVIGERARKLLHQRQLPGATVKVEYQTGFQDYSGVTEVKKYVMRFKVSEELPE